MDSSLAQRLRLLKWITLVLSVFVTTMLEVLDIVQAGTPGDRLIHWLVATLAVILVIMLAFRETQRLQEKLDRQLAMSRAQTRRQLALIQLSIKLATALDEAAICQAVSNELKPERLAQDYHHTGKASAHTANGITGVSYTGLKLYLMDEETGLFDLKSSTANTSEADSLGELTQFIEYEDPSSAPSETITRNIPLRVGNKSLGTLVVEARQGKTSLMEEDLSMLITAANLTALAIQNARMFAHHRRQREAAEQRGTVLKNRERYLTLLNNITRSALKSQDFQAMLQNLAELLGKLFEADGCFITLWNESQKKPLPVAAYGPLRQVIRQMHFESSDMTATESVLNSERALVIHDPPNSPYISPRLAAQLQSRLLLALPLIAGEDQKLGAAILSFQGKHSISQSEIDLGEHATSQIALAIAKARALELAEHRAQELSSLQEATAALLKTLDLEALLGQILDAAMSAIPASEKGALHLVARETGQLQIRAIQGYNDPRIKAFTHTDVQSYPARAVRQRRPLLINDVHSDPGKPFKANIPEVDAIGSTIVSPLMLGQDTLGAISLVSYRRYAFTQTDLRLLTSFADTATTAIQNAQLHAEVQRQAITDTLTGLYNRRGFFELGYREVERARRFKRPLSAMMIDLDMFKQVNDTYGHLIGDKVLMRTAHHCQQELRQIDLLGRYGGDELIALLPETSLDYARQVAERLRHSIAQTILVATPESVKVTFSVGVATLHREDELESLIERADRALYTAKQSGRNRVFAINSR
jgi:diguanylate cyclase (GGDEF)-like protein